MRYQLVAILLAIILAVGCGHTKKKPEFFVATHYGKIYLGPSIDYKKWGRFRPGAAWKILERHGDWVLVTIEPEALYIHLGYGLIVDNEKKIQQYRANLQRR